jgi:hypothetical protein
MLYHSQWFCFSDPNLIDTDNSNKNLKAGYQWLTPVSLATQEAEVRRIMVQSQLRQIVLPGPYLKKKKKSSQK